MDQLTREAVRSYAPDIGCVSGWDLRFSKLVKSKCVTFAYDLVKVSVASFRLVLASFELCQDHLLIFLSLKDPLCL